jgi:hypothetical protein
MQKAKAAVENFVSKSGHHDTTVHETVAPAVQHEVIKPTQHEEVVTATDREVHQDHYHRTVQPVHDREVLPENHEHKLGAVQHREFDHRDHDSTKQKLAAEASQFRDSREVRDTKLTQSSGAAVGGEHIHHHIHENIQPVVHKEVIQPNVVHTVVPIHEVHHNAATHHQTSELPPVSMSDFKSKGGALTGREERYDGFEGQPKNIGGVLGAGHTAGSHTHGEHSHHTGTTGSGLTGSGLTGSKGHSERTGLTGGGAVQEHNLGGHSGRGVDGDIPGEGYRAGRTDGEKYGNTTDSHHTGSSTTTGGKPSIMKKLNPFTDADGDGKKGVME